MADAAKTAALAERRLEELCRKVVTLDAYAVGKVLGHGPVGVLRPVREREMAICALNFYVLFLVVRKASAAGAIFGSLD